VTGAGALEVREPRVRDNSPHPHDAEDARMLAISDLPSDGTN
jgi:hypothetical protein